MKAVIEKATKKNAPFVVSSFVVMSTIFLAFSIVFAWLSKEVRDQETLMFDTGILHAIHRIHTEWLDAIALGLTQLGGVAFVPLFVLVLSIFLWHRAGRRAAGFVLLCVFGASVLNVVLKSIFSRSRPDLWDKIVHETSFSFPSGHAMASASLAISLVFLAWPTPWRKRAIFIGVLYMAVIGFTRLYLGVHYPTDIVAGWLVSGAWVFMVYFFLYKLATRMLAKR